MEVDKELYDTRTRFAGNPFVMSAIDTTKLDIEKMSIPEIDQVLKNMVDGPRQCGKPLFRHAMFLMLMDAQERKMKARREKYVRQILGKW